MTPLHVIQQEVRVRAEAIASTHGNWPCRKGCDDCCRRLASVPRVTQEEWQLIATALDALPVHTAELVRGRIRDGRWTDQQEIFRAPPERYFPGAIHYGCRFLFDREGHIYFTLKDAQAQVPEYQFRLRWTPGAIVFWDNRSTQHYAANDYYPERRRMERTAVIGDVPV
jgi:hypothetical protein